MTAEQFDSLSPADATHYIDAVLDDIAHCRAIEARAEGVALGSIKRLMRSLNWHAENTSLRDCVLSGRVHVLARNIINNAALYGVDTTHPGA